jgi:hypothetical protein
MLAKGGMILPLYQLEALVIAFKCKSTPGTLVLNTLSESLQALSIEFRENLRNIANNRPGFKTIWSFPHNAI